MRSSLQADDFESLSIKMNNNTGLACRGCQEQTTFIPKLERDDTGFFFSLIHAFQVPWLNPGSQIKKSSARDFPRMSYCQVWATRGRHCPPLLIISLAKQVFLCLIKLPARSCLSREVLIYPDLIRPVAAWSIATPVNLCHLRTLGPPPDTSTNHRWDFHLESCRLWRTGYI